MIRQLTSQLPEWARPDHPILRYELLRAKPALNTRARYMRALGVILVGLLLLLGGYLYATNLLREPAGLNLTDGVWRVLFFPMLVIQMLVGMIVLSGTINSVGEERRRQTWDNLRATETGAELALRTRWAAVFYRYRGWFGVMVAARVVLILGILYDLTAFRGGYLDMLTANIMPEVPLPIGVILLAFIMTASLLLPFTSVGLDASVGLLISSLFKHRVYATMLQIFLIALRLVVVGGLLFGVTQFIQGDLEIADALAWLLIGGFAAFGGWGLLLLQLGALGEIWASIPFSVFLGVGLLLFVLAQALLTDGILALAVRRAERHE